ncbi:alpha/beta fold hydrolase [Pseudoroseicyclus tamaricis]|uniref:Alpha/beta fold hydrolase n=1 Tax=Pseudoroseicyclus tamaricis TaxID=2705421 RepID=A0A6B2JTN2_9RHOB|nr:alpha/beta fold hydrolase [Pseudoroseicyclus tamaricis]NDU99533.1 alpha/beta fold hydrolase [Pseudoroseicyclus tamaricis]
MLHTTTYGEGGVPLVIAHGLYGSGRNWGVIGKRLSDRGRVILPDIRNHGQSPHFESHGYEDMAGDLAQVIAAEGGPADVLGHSMGGKAAMVLALTRPELVRRLVVVDIAPVAYSHTQSHVIEAARQVDLATVQSRAEAQEALGLDPVEASFLLQSLDMKARAWRLNLDVLEREMGRITGFPEVGGRFEGPAFFLSGGESSYVQPEHRERIKALFPEARIPKIPGAGHWVHADNPREVEAAVRAFLDA